MGKQTGKIILAADINVWPHEIETARALAQAGYTVEFIRRNEQQHATSADVLIDDIPWEMKAPRSDSLKAVQRNLHKALRQSRYVIFDCRRMKKIPCEAIEREVRTETAKFKSVKRLLFVTNKGKVIDIK